MEITEFFQDIKTPTTVVHVISVILGMGGALVSDVLFSFYGKDKKLNETEISTLSILSTLVFYSLILIILSGSFLFLSDTAKYMGSAKFLAKMSILVVLLINGYLLNKSVWPHLLKKDFFVSNKERNIRRLAFACGAISVISWLSIASLGVLDSLNMSYGIIISIYLFVILCGIAVSLLVEKRELD